MAFCRAGEVNGDIGGSESCEEGFLEAEYEGVSWEGFLGDETGGISIDGFGVEITEEGRYEVLRKILKCYDSIFYECILSTLRFRMIGGLNKQGSNQFRKKNKRGI